MSAARVDSTPTAGRHTARVVLLSRLSWLIAVPAMSVFVIHELLAGDLRGAAVRVSRASLPWIGLAIGIEVLSYVMYAAAQRCLLGREARGLRIRWLGALAVCAQGVNNFVPAGYLAAALLNFRELRRRGLAAPVSAWLLVRSSMLYIGALAVLTLIAGELAGGSARRSLEGARVGAGAVLLALPAAGMAARFLLARGVVRLPEAWRATGARSRLGAPAAGSAAGLFVLSWLFDAGCLVAAVHATGARPPWTLVPIAYCAAQLAAFVPITPGGVGLVEGTLAVALTAGDGTGAVLAAILLYRLISYWGTLPFGLLGYMAVRRGRLAGSSNPDGQWNPEPALGDRAPRGDRPLLVLEG